MPVAEIQSAERTRLVLALRKPLLPALAYCRDYSHVNAFNLAIYGKIAYWIDGNHIRDFIIAGATSGHHGIGPLDTGNVQLLFLGPSDSDMRNVKESFDFTDEKSTDTQLFRYSTAEYLVIAFRGTAGGTDIVTDGSSSLIPFAGCVGRVHKGFLTAFTSVVKVINDAVQKAPDLPVILTGHSLGGALATLAAAFIRHKYQRKVMVYTFGSPRVGDAEFAHHFTEVEPFVHYRCVHHKDLVPMVPPPYANLRLRFLLSSFTWVSAFVDPFGKPYTHLGKLVWLQRLPGNYVSVDVDKRTPAWHQVQSATPIRESRPKWDACAYFG